MNDSIPSLLREPGLVCFALPEEAKPFRAVCQHRPDARIVVTGMGRANSEREFTRAVQQQKPAWVMTCGYAGALSPALNIGDVVLSADSVLRPAFYGIAVIDGTFFCSDRVLVKAAEKQECHQKTGADAVEMESEIIRSRCKEWNIPSATVRVISDTANEDMPLDFSKLCTPDMQLDKGRLAWAILRAPHKIPALMQLQGHTRFAASRLAETLAAVLQ